MWLSPCSDVIGCREQRSKWKKSMRISTSIANVSTFPVHITLHSMISRRFFTHFCICENSIWVKRQSRGESQSSTTLGMFGMSSRSRSLPCVVSLSILLSFHSFGLNLLPFLCRFILLSAGAVSCVSDKRSAKHVFSSRSLSVLCFWLSERKGMS